MRDLILSVPDDERPVYLRIAEGLRATIQAGRVQPGERLPSTRVLSKKLGVHRHTVSAAMDELVAEGWLKAEARRSHQVSEVLPSQFFKPAKDRRPSLERKIEWRFAREVAPFGDGCAPKQPHRYRYLFEGGQPDLRLFPFDEFRGCLNDSLRNSPASRTGYGSPAGDPYFVERLQVYLGHMRALTGRPIIVTHGTQEGVFLVAQLLIKPGDKVAVEEIGYKAAWDTFRAAGGELVPVRVDKGGVDPDSLEAAIKKHRVRLIYLTPHHQYPTTATLCPGRRLQIYELANRYQIPIFEDDYDHEFHYRCQPIAPLASNDPSELVIYASTLSKVMCPSMRIGFMAVPELLYERLVNLRALVTRQNSAFLQDAVARWMDNGGFERHLRRMRRAYMERRDTLIEMLQQGVEQGLPLTWEVPDGGMALWLNSGVDSDAATRKASELGVFAMPESAYHLEDRGPGTHIRLGFASQNPQEIKAGMRLLNKAIASVADETGKSRHRKTA